MEKIFAQTTKDLGTIGGQGLGPFAIFSGTRNSPAGAVEGLRNITNIVSALIGVITVAAGIWFMFNFIVGGLQWINGGGDKNALHNAQQRITNAFIGLIIVSAGWTILTLAGKFIGYDIIISRPDVLINSLFPGR